MIRPIYLTVITFFLINTASLEAQDSSKLPVNVVKAVSAIRTDIYARKKVYENRINRIVAHLDTSSLSLEQKNLTFEFIQLDTKTDVLSKAPYYYESIPKDSPYRNRYMEEYIYNHQDYAIDKGLVKELKEYGLFDKEVKLVGPKIEELQKDLEFLDVHQNDRLLCYFDWASPYALLLGYTFQGVDITMHNQYQENHYLALDRADRYPNINNGNVIEFIIKENPRLMIKGEKWDKIILRNTDFQVMNVSFILKSFHDNLTDEGALFIYHKMASDDESCSGKLTEKKLMKILSKAEFKLIDKLNLGCSTYYKFQPVSE